jgi:hypothetical protein
MSKLLNGLALLGVGMLCSCASMQKTPEKTTQNYVTIVKSWRGGDLDPLFKVWGYPDHIGKLPNGHKLFTYRVASWEPYLPYANATSLTNVPMTTARAPQAIKGYDDRGGCTTTFEVDPKRERIVEVGFQGGNCQVSESFVMQRGYFTSDKNQTL